MDNKRSVHIKQIVGDHWSTWIGHNEAKIPENMRSSVAEAVEKMLGCGDPKNGYTKYQCVSCDKAAKKIVPFSCKSRFCPRCGKRYVDEWVDKQVDRILNVSHRHTVFTIPEELRGRFYWNRELLDDLCNLVADVIQTWYTNKTKKGDRRKSGKKWRGDEVGIICVVHTFGRDMKFNPHIHALVTEGALTRDGRWKRIGYIPYKYLRKAWQKLVLDLVIKHFGHEPKMRNLVNSLYHRYKDGFYVHAENRMKDARGAARYIGRYLARPAIAEYRITGYDGKQVDFWYVDHRTDRKIDESISAEEFIGRLIMHIPKKHSRMVHRYGLYRRNRGKLPESLGYIRPKKQLTNRVASKTTWRERAKESFGKDPIECPHCGSEMELWEIWHPDKGFLYHILHEEETPLGRRWRRNVERRMGDPLSEQQARRMVQLPLYEMQDTG